ncbi:MAG: hypothetical protein HDKAJFGB_02465 [Anaerolineae bacterium]|nr:hypothetical protein [Anaerolineae bacterium]
MSTRSEFFRDALVTAFGICAAIALLVFVALWFFDVLSWLWFARIILAAAVGAALVGGFILLRTLRARHVRRNQYGLYRTDRTAGCTAGLLIAFVLAGLAICGGVLEWFLEFR